MVTLARACVFFAILCSGSTIPNDDSLDPKAKCSALRTVVWATLESAKLLSEDLKSSRVFSFTAFTNHMDTGELDGSCISSLLLHSPVRMNALMDFVRKALWIAQVKLLSHDLILGSKRNLLRVFEETNSAISEKSLSSIRILRSAMIEDVSMVNAALAIFNCSFTTGTVFEDRIASPEHVVPSTQFALVSNYAFDSANEEGHGLQQLPAQDDDAPNGPCPCAIL